MNFYAPLIGLVFLLLLAILFMSIRLDQATQQNREYQSQIESLRDNSIRQEQRFMNARENANTAMKEFQKTIDKIQEEKVRSNCKDAIEWGVKKAHEFS